MAEPTNIHPPYAVSVSLNSFTKVYEARRVVDQVSLSIQTGEIFGLLGPNGAGKTTTLEAMVGLRSPSSGTVRILGLDPHKQRSELVHLIGLQPQEANLFPNLRVIETLKLFSSFHRDGLVPEEVLNLIGLEEHRNMLVRKLSGGQRQRLVIGVALIANPRILFLDEPTGSLDPQARRQLWSVIQAYQNRGGTVVLTTHSMEEAQALCHRVAIINEGKIVALGTPHELIHQHFPGQTVVCQFTVEPDHQMLHALPGVVQIITRPLDNGCEARLRSQDPGETLKVLLSLNGPTPEVVRTEQATLEDVFLVLTGRSLGESAE